MKTALDQDDFEFDPEEFARVIREVGVEVVKFQEHVMLAYQQFGNAWNKIITPEFREMVERAVEDNVPIKGTHLKFAVIDEPFEVETCHCGRLVDGTEGLGCAPHALCSDCLPHRCDAHPLDCPYLYDDRCPQCGMKYSERACGPTHAILAYEKNSKSFYDSIPGEERGTGTFNMGDEPLSEYREAKES